MVFSRLCKKLLLTLATIIHINAATSYATREFGRTGHFHQDTSRLNPSYPASAAWEADCMRMLIPKDPTEALCFAIRENFYNLAWYLLVPELRIRYNAKMKITSPITMTNPVSPDSCDSSGRPVLQIAAELGHIKIVNLLLFHGANANQQHIATGNTALHEAARFNRLTSARALLAYGASPLIMNLFKETPLNLAQANTWKSIDNEHLVEDMILAAKKLDTTAKFTAALRPQTTFFSQKHKTR